MIEEIIKKFAHRIQVNTEFEQEVLEFGLKAIFSNFLCIGIALLLSVLLGTQIFTLIFILLLTPLKIETHSYHCKDMKNCVLFYNILVLTNMSILSVIKVGNFLLLIMCIINFMYLLIVDYSENLFKKIVFYMFFVVFIYKYNCDELIMIMFLAIVNTVFLVKLQKIVSE